MPHGEAGPELCGRRLGRMGDLPERFRDELLRGRLSVPARQGVQPDQPRVRSEPGQVVRPPVGRSRAIVRARHACPAVAALHGSSLQPRAAQELPGHEGADVRVQVITQNGDFRKATQTLFFFSFFRLLFYIV